MGQRLGGSSAAGTGLEQGFLPGSICLALGQFSLQRYKAGRGTRRATCSRLAHSSCGARRVEKIPPVAAVLNQHCNCITSWAVDEKGEVKHVYA